MTWRDALEWLCLRGLEVARAERAPVGESLIQVQEKWHRRHVEMRRDEHGLVVMAGGRFLRIHV